MKVEEYLKIKNELFEKADELTKKKGHDYSGKSQDTLSNVKITEKLGLTSTMTGILVRLTDKLARLVSFNQQGEFAVADEKYEDTVVDAINYLTMLVAVKREQDGSN